MNPTTLAFLVGVLLGAPAGLMLAALLAASARAEAEQKAYLAGLEKGKALARFPRRPAA